MTKKITDFTKPGHEGADAHWQGDELREHYAKPFAFIGRASAKPFNDMGNPYVVLGEVRIVAARELGTVQVQALVGWGKLADTADGTDALAWLDMDPAEALATAAYLVLAAALVDGGGVMSEYHDAGSDDAETMAQARGHVLECLDIAGQPPTRWPADDGAFATAAAHARAAHILRSAGFGTTEPENEDS